MGSADHHLSCYETGLRLSKWLFDFICVPLKLSIKYRQHDRIAGVVTLSDLKFSLFQKLLLWMFLIIGGLTSWVVGLFYLCYSHDETIYLIIKQVKPRYHILLTLAAFLYSSGLAVFHLFVCNWLLNDWSA